MPNDFIKTMSILDDLQPGSGARAGLVILSIHANATTGNYTAEIRFFGNPKLSARQFKLTGRQ